MSLETVKKIVEILAILVAGVWVAYTFVYQEMIKPAFAPPTLVIDSAAKVEGMIGERYVVRLTTTLRNVGKRKAEVLAYWYDISAQRFSERKAPPGEYGQALIAHLNRDEERLARFGGSTYGFARNDFLEAGLLVERGWWLEPNEKVTMVRIALVPGKYQAARLGVYARTVLDGAGICLQWEQPDAETLPSGVAPGPEPMTYLKTDTGGQSCRGQAGYERFADSHKALGRRKGLSTTVSKLDLALVAPTSE